MSSQADTGGLLSFGSVSPVELLSSRWRDVSGICRSGSDRAALRYRVGAAIKHTFRFDPLA
jgi:hypothetical protein